MIYEWNLYCSERDKYQQYILSFRQEGGVFVKDLNVTLFSANLLTSLHVWIHFPCFLQNGPISGSVFLSFQLRADSNPILVFEWTHPSSLSRLAQSVQRLATGWTVRESNAGGGEIFRTCPDRPCGPPCLLYNGYSVFSGGKERPGRDADPSPPTSAVVMNGQNYTSTPPIGRTACTEPQFVYKGDLYLYLFTIPLRMKELKIGSYWRDVKSISFCWTIAGSVLGKNKSTRRNLTCVAHTLWQVGKERLTVTNLFFFRSGPTRAMTSSFTWYLGHTQ